MWTDDPLIPGRTPVKAVHFAELRASINDLLTGCGGTAFRFTDAALTVGVTPVRALHVTELRTALDAAYAACGGPRPVWSDPALQAGAAVVRAVHITELRAAVTGLRDPEATSFTLSGTVRDSRANGTAVAGATVRLDTGQSTSAAADGRYRFTNLSGEVTVTAGGAHHVAASVEVTMDRNRTVDFVLDHTGEPPFSGTVFFPDILRPSDPTNLEGVTYTGRGDRLIYDRRVEEWTTVDAFLFAVRIHEQELEFQVNPEFGSVDAARAEVDTYAPALGRLPAFMLSRARKVQVNAGDEPFGGNWRDRSFLIHTDRGRSYIDRGIIEEVFFHEAAHVSLDGDHGAAPGWLAAQQADGGVFISAYARDFPAREDVAESILPYFAVRERPERLSPADRSAVLNAIPNRLAYFDRQGFVELQDSAITITPVTQGVSVTDRSQILVELAPEDVVAANLLDLAGRTLIFTPDGEGGYARSVLGLAWDDELGGTVRDGDQIELGFGFAFSGREWGSFFVSERGAVTFGAPHPFSGTEPRRFGTMQQIADAFVGPPTISALYKKYAGGSVNVSSRADRAVITWMMEDVAFSVYGRRPKEPFGVQAVLHADGRVAFSYGHDPEDPDEAFRDGIAGLFPTDLRTTGVLGRGIPDRADPSLPAHLDLLETVVYSLSNPRYVLVEFTTRGPIRPVRGREAVYRLELDADQPWWSEYDRDDRDFLYGVSLKPDGRVEARWDAARPYDVEAGDNRIGLLIRLRGFPGVAASVVASTAEYDAVARTWTSGNRRSTPTVVDLPDEPDEADLSQPDPRPSSAQSEIFRYPMIRDIAEVSCRIVEVLGDEFDFFAFNSQFRVDQQQTGPAHGFAGSYPGNIKVEGIGIEGDEVPPCDTRLSNSWGYPVWMKARTVVDHGAAGRGPYDSGLTYFAHEIGHTWLAYVGYSTNGERLPLVDPDSPVHWMKGLHAPAPFPWRGRENGSVMGGNYWRENPDGTFTPTSGWTSRGGGFSWLDLYLMGLAAPEEVPDMFVLRNLRETGAGWGGAHAAEKEVVTMEQVLAAMGPRIPSPEWARETFNTGFVYFLLPAQEPVAGLLHEHARYRDRAIAHWHHVTGGRGRLTSEVRARRSP